MKHCSTLLKICFLFLFAFIAQSSIAQNVGIGTANPGKKLEIYDNINSGHIQPANGLLRLNNSENTTCSGTVNIWDVRVGNCGQMGITTYQQNLTPYFNLLKASANQSAASDGPVASFSITAPINSLMLDVNGNIGLGFYPSTKLHVHLSTDNGNLFQLTDNTTGTAATDGFLIRMPNAANENVELVNQENAGMLFYTNGTERLRLESAGNVRVTNLTTNGVVKTINGTGTLTSGLIVNADVNDVDWSKITNVPNGSNGFIYNQFTAAQTAEMWISGRGRFGNGTTVYGDRVEVRENLTGNGYSYIDFRGDDTYTDFGLRLLRGNTGANTTSELRQRGTGQLTLVTQEAAPLIFATTNTERMRVQADGKVGIGTTAPANLLEVKGGHSDTQFRLFSDLYAQGINGVNTAVMTLWASEPSATWTGAGIGNNIYNTANFPRLTTTRGGSYIRLLENQVNINVVSATGTDIDAFSVISGAYGMGGIKVGQYHTLNSHSNTWLYVGDQSGSVFGSRGVAMGNLYAASSATMPFLGGSGDVIVLADNNGTLYKSATNPYANQPQGSMVGLCVSNTSGQTNCGTLVKAPITGWQTGCPTGYSWQHISARYNGANERWVYTCIKD